MTNSEASDDNNDLLSEELSTRLEDLVDQFELARDSGMPTSPEQLCVGAPELLKPLNDALRRLNSVDNRLASIPPFGFPDWIGDFRVIEPLGTGSTGMVFRCRQTNPDRDVAVKVLKPLLDADEQLSRFRREMAVFGTIHGAGLAEVYQSGIVEWCGVRCSWIAMELFDQGDICKYSRTHPQRTEDSLELFRKLCTTLRSAHRLGILHRDIKPSNILMSSDGDPHLVDFGIAKLPTPVAGIQSTETGTAAMRGTTAWMAPELLTGDQSVRSDMRSEIFSLGVVLAEMLTGRHPFDADRLSAGQVAVRIAQQQNRPQEFENVVSADLKAFLQKLMAYAPEDRYQNLDEVLADLERLQSGLPVRGRSVPVSEAVWRWGLQHKSIVLLCCSFGLMIAVALSTWLYSRKVQDAEERAAQAVRLAEERIDSARNVARLHLQLLKEQNLRAATNLPQKPGDLAEQLRQFRESRDSFEEYLKLYPEDHEIRTSAGTAFHLLGIAANRVNQHTEAIESFKRGEQIFRELNREYPGDPEFEFDIFSTVLGRAGTVLGTPESVELHQWCLELICRLSAESPDDMDFADAKACVLVALGNEYAVTESIRDLPRARSLALEAHELAKSICQRPDFKPLHRKHIASSAAVLRIIEKFEDRFAEALNWSRIAVAEQTLFLKDFPDPDSQALLVRYYMCESEDCLQLCDVVGARKSLDKAISKFEEIKDLLKEFHGLPFIKHGLVLLTANVEKAELTMGR